MRRRTAARGNTSMNEKLDRISWDAPNNRWIVTGGGKLAAKYFVQWSSVLSRYTCTCPDWRYRRMGDNQDCKHIHYIVEILQYGSKEELEAIGVKK